MELQVIQNKIYEVRGQKIMLDFDLAEMYGTETKYLKRSVKRNLERFPNDFMFELTNYEWNTLRCQICTSNRGGNRYLPYAFTELGVSMLSSVLNSNLAIEINISIMRAFVAVRKMIANPPRDKISDLEKDVKALKAYIEEVFADYNDINEDTRLQLELINRALAELQSQKKLSDRPRSPIGYAAYKNK